MSTTILNRPVERKINDLCAALDRAVLGREWKFLQFPFGWVLVVFYDAGIVDHPMREMAGGEGGKGQLKWYDRNHEILGIAGTPEDAARSVLSGGKGARLKAFRAAVVGETGRRIFFKGLDSGIVFQPGPSGLVQFRAV